MDQGITKEDLRQFRLLIINDIREILKGNGNTSLKPEDTEWLRSKEVRKILNISPGTLQNMRIQGKLRFRKVMGSYYYFKHDLSKLFNEQV